MYAFSTLDYPRYFNSMVPFHQFTFNHSISWMFLLDKPNEICKNYKKFEKNTLIHQRKAFEKKRKLYYNSKDKCPNSTNFFRRPKINNSFLSNGKQKELKIKLGQLRKEILQASLPVSAHLRNDFKSIFETNQRKISPFIRLFSEDQQKYLKSFQNNATYHPMNSDTDVTYQTVSLFSSG